MARNPFTPPQKALILKPCCLSQVLLTTPLLAILSQSYPQAQFDWAVSGWARPAVASNPRITKLVGSGQVGLPGGSWREIWQLAGRLRQEQYDTCFIPSRYRRLALLAWLAGIPQRVGLGGQGRGLFHTFSVPIPPENRHAAHLYLLLARHIGLDGEAETEFYPPDADRTKITQFLVDEVDWLGDVPLVIMHPGGGVNPVQPDMAKRWPVERLALLGNHLIKQYGARILLVGDSGDAPLAEAAAGLMVKPAANLAGRLSLTELGALGEVADLYVGNDCGPTHVAVAVGCPTLAIFGPSSAAFSGPYTKSGRIETLQSEPQEGPFSWEKGVSVEEAIAAAGRLLRKAEKPAK